MFRIRLILAVLLALPAAAATALWLIGRILTDSLPLTQYLFWIPALLLLPPAALLACGAWAVDRVGRPRQLLRSRGARRWRRTLSVLALVCIGCLGWQALLGWRLYRAVLPRPQPDPSGSLTVLHWNMGAQHPDIWRANLSRLTDDPLPDLLLLTNAHQGSRFRELHEHTGYDTRQWRHLAVASRLPLLRSAGATLQLPRPEDYPSGGGNDASRAAGEPNPDPRVPGWYDPGQILVAEVDTSEALGRPIVVWIIDLPSDPSIARRAVATLVLARLKEIDAQWRAEAAGGFDGLAPADLIAGDFNMPRGSTALARLAEGLAHAYDQGGWGIAATYPSLAPWWHIDHMFLRAPFRAARYETADIGDSPHLAQRAVIVADR